MFFTRREAIQRTATLFGGAFRNYSAENRNLPPGDINPPAYADNLLGQVYGREPLFFTNHLEDKIRATVETSLYYPLEFKILALDATSVAGNNVSDPFGPANSFHWIVFHMFVNTDENGPLKFSILFEDFDSGNAPPVARCTLHRATLSDFDAGTVAVIGSANYEVVEDAGGVPHQISQVGLRPVYLNSSMALIHAFTGLDGAGIVERRIVYLELPESQPFGPLISTL